MNFGELEILHHKVLTRTVTDFAFPELLGLGLFPEERVEGITAQWDILSPARQKGTFRVPGEPAARVELERVGSRTASCILMLLEKALDEATLAWLRLAGAVGWSRAARCRLRPCRSRCRSRTAPRGSGWSAARGLPDRTCRRSG